MCVLGVLENAGGCAGACVRGGVWCCDAVVMLRVLGGAGAARVQLQFARLPATRSVEQSAATRVGTGQSVARLVSLPWMTLQVCA